LLLNLKIMTDTTTTRQFLDIVSESFTNELLIKITLGKSRKKTDDLKNVFIRPVIIGQNNMLSFIYRHKTNDITKNYTLDESLKKINDLLHDQFRQANLFDKTRDVQVVISKNEKFALQSLKPSSPLLQALTHDKIKKRLIEPNNKPYLQQLGITNSSFGVIPNMNSKFRQINKFVEVIDSILPKITPTEEFTVIDMGSGKGYLTFALYDHLVNNLKIAAAFTGVEMRPELVEKCNRISKNSNFDHLNFVSNNIRDYELKKINMLIALHACDTATDEAISKGITAGADYIVVAPCCHKQVRKSMNPNNELKHILKHGVYLERQAELLTDALRGLILEEHGYKIKTLEFISTEHTPKNVMIIAAKTTEEVDKNSISNQIAQIKKSFGIEYHHLELLLEGY